MQSFEAWIPGHISPNTEVIYYHIIFSIYYHIIFRLNPLMLSPMFTEGELYLCSNKLDNAYFKTNILSTELYCISLFELNMALMFNSVIVK